MKKASLIVLAVASGWIAGTVLPIPWPAGPRVPSGRGQTVGVQKRGSGMSTTVSMPGLASCISGM